ncbi:hypothetical protein [Sabulibacter ruber]|uniref:hypothetical protein n=1 Tax=Sabulibacter ruber TaxID=2811901 RepID=UPI001A962151|nr:hypothetical protein [Sabulibacter ruber]
MFRSILSVLGGTAIGVFTISLIQSGTESFYPSSVEILLREEDVISNTFSNYPTGALLLNLLGFAIGSFLGGMVAARLVPHKRVGHALAVGAFLLAMGIANLLPAYYPLWFKLVSFLIYLPMAYLGGMMSMRRIP